ncbi:50S ribosomal protein L4 [Guyparkeria hydrothermalis]|uniref:Large ribosomal subunit protein uL4 n=1 Tax=Guyparkeria halophila TaxID=47960 RepID=A0A6I6DBV9_9GAMM|nr:MULTISPECIES: 50S ribosomal protein L4 [Guyparkeria]MCL7750777.1 50S ribosomal protein L4 [Guyparkeria hydrothermalis]QGT79232.1 50S ribosomal protein L4 [Guyparkeria halophila]TKA88838.1 50S ribosomal protein L4 [Guyparkeria sp. SB14A]
MDIQVKNGSALNVSEQVFGREYNEALVHQAVVAFLAGGRAGTKKQLSRSEVSGGNTKPWRQKGTGRARAGTTRGPIWRTGGVTFAARPRDFSQKMNRKAYRAAMRSIFSELLRQDRLVVVESLTVDAPKTKQVVKALNDLGLEKGKRLIVTEAMDEALLLGSRNVVELGYRTAGTLDPVSLVDADKVVITQGALKMVEEWLS